MSRTWYAFDHHLGHANILTFRGLDGNLIRPGFRDIDDHDQTIVARHNERVADDDTVYFGGDVAFTPAVLRRYLPTMRGKKKLLMGNHDRLKTSQYAQQFEDIGGWIDFLDDQFASVRGSKQDGKLYIVNHYPIHPMAFEQPGGVKCCVHGHIHEKWVPRWVMQDNRLQQVRDMRYLNLSMERINYYPVSHEQIVTYIEEQGL